MKNEKQKGGDYNVARTDKEEFVIIELKNAKIENRYWLSSHGYVLDTLTETPIMSESLWGSYSGAYVLLEGTPIDIAECVARAFCGLTTGYFWHRNGNTRDCRATNIAVDDS